MIRPPYATLFFVATVLLLAIALVAGAALRPLEPAFQGPLSRLLPPVEAMELAGWTVTSRPVGETPELKQAVAEVLNFSDAHYIVYQKNAVRISLYLAYWSPGRMPHRLVAGHTPDVCWTSSGWAAQSVGTTTVWCSSIPFEQRVFASPLKELEHVVWCHLVSGRPFSYGTGREPPWYASIADLWRLGIRQREEQFFIRISSNAPWDRVRDSTPVRVALLKYAEQAKTGASPSLE